jgi:hypothetical protein
MSSQCIRPVEPCPSVHGQPGSSETPVQDPSPIFDDIRGGKLPLEIREPTPTGPRSFGRASPAKILRTCSIPLSLSTTP